jgi:hypothetical protein
VTEGDAGTCPRCGAQVEPGQEYCLECGLRLPGGGLAAAVASRQAPPWLLPVLGGLVIAALMAAFAIWIAANEEPDPFLAATGPSTVAVPTTSPTVAPTTVPTETPTEPPPPTTKPKPKPTLVDWPQSQNGYTIVIASLPSGGGRSVATAKARETLRSGLPEVGVLNSGEFSSLHPGYYVVFSGIYDDQRSALDALSRAQDLYPAAYIRQITH